jgi:hypothetical protein
MCNKASGYDNKIIFLISHDFILIAIPNAMYLMLINMQKRNFVLEIRKLFLFMNKKETLAVWR